MPLDAARWLLRMRSAITVSAQSLRGGVDVHAVCCSAISTTLMRAWKHNHKCKKSDRLNSAQPLRLSAEQFGMDGRNRHCTRCASLPLHVLT